MLTDVPWSKGRYDSSSATAAVEELEHTVINLEQLVQIC